MDLFSDKCGPWWKYWTEAEEDGEMDRFVEDYQEEEEESLEEGSILGRAKNKVLYNNIHNITQNALTM